MDQIHGGLSVTCIWKPSPELHRNPSEDHRLRTSMASAVLANRNEPNWPQPRGGAGAGAGFMGKVPFSNPNPKNPKRQFHFHAPTGGGDYNGCQIDESPAATQAVSDDASSINRRPNEFNLGHSQYVRFDIASYSRKELSELKSRLIAELEQIRQLKTRIEAGDLHPRPPHNPPTKKSMPSSKKVAGNKRPLPLNSNPVGKDSNSKRLHWDNVNLMKNCVQILSKLMKHKHAWIFKNPVDVVGMGLHDYYDIIRRPMDLGTVKSNLGKNLYAAPSDFANDVRLTFNNAMTYNPKGHDVYAMAEQLLTRFEELFRPVNEKLADGSRPERVYDEDLQASSWNHVEPERPKREESVRIEKKSEQIRAPASSSNPPLVQSPVRTPTPVRAPPVKPLKQPKPKAKDPNKREMSMEEKHKLGIGLQSLPQEKMEQVVQIIRKRNGHLKQDGDEIELDIEAVDTETLWELDRLVTNWKKMVSKIKRQALMGNNNVPANKGNGVNFFALIL